MRKRCSYDLLGNITSITDPENRVWEFTYDLGLRTKTKDPLPTDSDKNLTSIRRPA